MNVLDSVQSTLSRTSQSLSGTNPLRVLSTAGSDRSVKSDLKGISQFAFGIWGNTMLIVPSVTVLYLLLNPPATTVNEDGEKQGESTLMRIVVGLGMGLFVAFGVEMVRNVWQVFRVV